MYMNAFDSKLGDVDVFSDRKLLFAGRGSGHVKNVLTAVSAKDSIRIEFGVSSGLADADVVRFQTHAGLPGQAGAARWRVRSDNPDCVRLARPRWRSAV